MTCIGRDESVARLFKFELANNAPSHPFHFFYLNGLTWIDWVGIIALILTIIGFGITWWQLHRTQTARRAVAEFIKNSNRETANARMTKTLSSLLTLHNKVNDAVGKDDSIALQKALENWTRTCSRVIPQLARVQTLPRRTQIHGRSGQEMGQFAGSAEQFIAARLTVDEALLKLRGISRKTRLASEISHALSRIHECSNLAVMILEQDQYREAA
jgi:hypothetical protein